MKIIDLTPEITEEMAVFPGDVPFKRNVSLDILKGSNLTLSSISTTLHLGAHADGPNHYLKPEAQVGGGISTRRLEYYIGLAQVIEVKIKKGTRILPQDLEGTEINAPRVLFKTGSYPHPNHWDGEFCSLSASLVEHLAQKGVILVGIDTPSIDLSADKVLESHGAVGRNDMAVLEGLDLSQTAQGLYTLVALPLKIKDADASPVRAILLQGVLWND